MSFQAYNGSILIDRATLKHLLWQCKAEPLKSDSTLFDVGYETAKQKIAQVLCKEFGIDLGHIDVNDAIRMLDETY